MRRKSARNASKTSAEKTKTPETPVRQTRRSRRGRKVSESVSGSEASDDEAKQNVEITTSEPLPPAAAAAAGAATEVANQSSEEVTWKVTKTESHAGEIQKLKISVCRTSPSTPERTSKRRRNKSSSQNEDDSATDEPTVRRTRQHGSPLKVTEEVPEEREDKRGKGKSKGKHKTKIESTTQLSEVEMQKQCEISANVQVTPQSPSDTDKPVDNESIPDVESNDTNEQKLAEDVNKSLNAEEEQSNQQEIRRDQTESDQVIKTEIKNESSQNDIEIKAVVNVKLDLKSEEPNNDNEVNVKTQLKEEFKTETPNILAAIHKEECKGFVKSECKPEIINEVKIETDNVCSIDKKEVIVKPDKAEVNEALPESDPAVDSTETPEVENSVAEINVAQETSEEATSTTAPCEASNETETESTQQNAEPMDTTEEMTSEKVEDEPTTVQESVVQPVEDPPVKDDEKDDEKNVNEQSPKAIVAEEKERPSSPAVTSNQEEPSEIDNSAETSSTKIQEDNTKSKRSHRLILKRSRRDTSMDEKISISEEPVAITETPEPVEVHAAIEHVPIVDKSQEAQLESEQIPESSVATALDEEETRKTPKAAKKRLQPIKLKRNFEEREPKARERSVKIKWSNDFDHWDMSNLNAIDYDLIKTIYSDVDLLDEKDLKLDLVESRNRRVSVDQRSERKMSEASDNDQSVGFDRQSSYNSHKSDNDADETTNIIAMNRKISIVDDSASKLKPPPSPAKHPVSSVLFITNLVRPFTLKQLKELLERTGKIVDDGFWTDRIKSKCYVQYETQEEAEATRNALHGVNWPIGNGKKLMIDFASLEDLETARNPPAKPPETLPAEKENLQPAVENVVEAKDDKKKESHVREWDVGKEGTYNAERARSMSRDRHHRTEKRRHSRHSPSPSGDFLNRKQKKVEDVVPQKLMDDLFQKTKAMPSIYWQPLTPEEIATKQQQRLQRMAEHKRRLEETSRTRADFPRGGPNAANNINPANRRRYD